jgi:N-acyl-D-aspartate/D-glutamate deacylase
MTARRDIVIRNGTVIDGTGAGPQACPACAEAAE